MRKSYLLLLLLALLTASCSNDDNDPVDPPTPDENVLQANMLKQWEAYYFRPNYNNDPNKPVYSNYFVELAQTEVGYDGFLSYPMVEGEYILDLDLNVLGLSDSPNSPYIPAGTYHATNTLATDKDVDYTFNLANTMLIKNVGKGDTEGTFRYHRYTFTDGEVVVERNGNDYKIDATFTCTQKSSDNPDAAEPQKIHVTFAGTIDVTNPSPGEDLPYHYDKDINLTPVLATSTLWEEETSDNYMLRFFSTTNITSDAIHVNEPGMKMQFSLNAPKGKGIAGVYTIADTGKPGTANAGKRWGSAAEGSYAEVVNDDLTIQYSLFKSGTVTITERGDGTYTATADGIDSNGHSVKLSFNGKFLTGKLIVPTSTLRGDVTFNAKQCTDILTFGDIVGNGTTDVWVTLADESRVLMLDLLLPGTNLTTIPAGRYQVRANNYNANTIVPGSVEFDGGKTYINPTAYIEYNVEEGTARNYAPIIGGYVDVTRNGDKYTFTYELNDDYSSDFVTPAYNKIRGSVTTTLPAFHGPESGSEQARKARRIK